MTPEKKIVSLETYALAVENSPLAFQLFELMDENDLGSFTFRVANESCERQTGVNMKPYIGMSLNESFPDLVNTAVPTLYFQALKSNDEKQ